MIRAAWGVAGLLLCLAGPLAAQETLNGAAEQTDQTLDPQALIRQSEAGDSAAQTRLALLYHAGEGGVVQNYATAADWARRAAEAGEPAAQNLLGRYYHTGLGVTQDQAEAIRWLRAAAESGEAQYLLDLGYALETGGDGTADHAGAAEAYARAAEAGLPDAMVSLGVLYQEGRGVEQDFARARALYEEAAATGHPRAQNNLGLLYVRGDGVPQDYARAAELFANAAEAGLPGALRNLGVMYENGFGVPLDEARAAELYRMAGGEGTNQGDGVQTGAETAPALAYDPRLAPPPEDAEGLEALQRMAAAGDPVAEFQMAWLLVTLPDAPPAALYQAAQLFAAAAAAGHAPAMRNLGLLYFEGRGVPQDYVLGRMWLTLAGAAGADDAPALMEELSGTMTAAQINEAQSRAENLLQGKL